MKQQTPVEWYAEKSIKLFDALRKRNITFQKFVNEQAVLLGQAKAMESKIIKSMYSKDKVVKDMAKIAIKKLY